jgi:hypothetical protein
MATNIQFTGVAMNVDNLEIAMKSALLDQQLIDEEKCRHKLMKLYQYKKKWIVEIYEAVNSRNNARTRVFANLLLEEDVYRTVPTLATKYRIFRAMYEFKLVDQLEFEELVRKL